MIVFTVYKCTPMDTCSLNYNAHFITLHDNMFAKYNNAHGSSLNDSIESKKTLGLDKCKGYVELHYICSKSCLHIHTFYFKACIVACVILYSTVTNFEAKPVANCYSRCVGNS